jgi:ribosomal protein S18 acetylase RimI-like enzyme
MQGGTILWHVTCTRRKATRDSGDASDRLRFGTKQMIEQIEVRDARPEELDEVAQLLEESYRQYAQIMPPEAWESYRQDIRNVRARLTESQLIVALLDERVAGAVTLYLNGSASLSWPDGWAGVRLLGVHPSFRGKGVGKELMEECVRRARSAGVKTIGLHTTTAMVVAQRLYEKMGFVRVREFDFHPDEEVVVMAYKLDI